jgi:CBS domain-containing protein
MLAKNLRDLATTFASRARWMVTLSAPSVIGQIMTPHPRTCYLDDTLDRAVRIMKERDCGSVPVVDADGRVQAMITDRDICLAAYEQRRPLADIRIASAASRSLVAARESETLETAEKLMKQHRVRRLPVVDEQGRAIGILSVSDLVRHAHFWLGKNGVGVERIASTLATLCQPLSRRG